MLSISPATDALKPWHMDLQPLCAKSDREWSRFERDLRKQMPKREPMLKRKVTNTLKSSTAMCTMAVVLCNLHTITTMSKKEYKTILTWHWSLSGLPSYYSKVSWMDGGTD